MSTADERIAAEYALGTLDRRQRAEVEARMRHDRAFLSLVETWSGRLLAVEPADAPVEPSASLLDRIEVALDDAAAIPGTRSIRRDEGAWVEATPGVSTKLLHSDPETGSDAYLVRLSPGATMPSHAHRRTEECVVLEGEIFVGGTRLRPGDFHVAPGGVVHPPITTESGAVFYIHGELKYHAPDTGE